MISFRRFYLDKFLYSNIQFIHGRVLDIGGKKIGKRGNFSPPLDNVEIWEYLNTDPLTDPDYCCSSENIPLPDVSVDTVIMTELLEYLPDPKLVLAEIYRVIKDKGKVLISVPFLNPIHGDYWVDRHRYTPVALKEMALKEGFSINKLEPMGSVGAVLYDILRVAFGYADVEVKYRKCLQFLERSKNLFFYIDRTFDKQKNYINTGYFMVISKNNL